MKHILGLEIEINHKIKALKENTVRTLESKPPKALNAIKDDVGMMKIKLDKVLKCWEEHYKVNFNAKFPYGKSVVMLYQKQHKYKNIAMRSPMTIRSAIEGCNILKSLVFIKVLT